MNGNADARLAVQYVLSRLAAFLYVPLVVLVIRLGHRRDVTR